MPKAVYDKIQLGMTSDQVVALAGVPTSKGTPGASKQSGTGQASQTSEGFEQWMYGRVMVMFSQGKVTNKMGY